MVSTWVSWIIAVFQTLIDWLGSMKIIGQPIIWYLIAFFLLKVIIGALIYKP